MDRSEALSVLSNHGWLERVPTTFRAALLQRASLHRYGPGRPLFEFGDPPGGIYGVAMGTLALTLPAPDGDLVMAHVAMIGAWLGSEAMFTRADRRCGLRSLQRSAVLHVPLASIDEMTAADPGDWRHFGRLAAEEAGRAHAAMATLLVRDGRRRALSTLARLALCEDARLGAGGIAVTQAMLAELANQSRSSIGTLLADLEATGVLTVGYRRLMLRDAARLRRELALPADAGSARRRLPGVPRRHGRGSRP